MSYWNFERRKKSILDKSLNFFTTAYCDFFKFIDTSFKKLSRANKIWASGRFMRLIVVGLAVVGNIQKHSLCTRALLQMLTIVPLSVLVWSVLFLFNMAKLYSGLHSKCLQIAPSPPHSSLVVCSSPLFNLAIISMSSMPDQMGGTLSTSNHFYNVKFTNYR
jgi:hypothetical protein